MRYALSVVGALALYWCLINLAAVWRSHVEQRRRAMGRHPAWSNQQTTDGFVTDSEEQAWLEAFIEAIGEETDDRA